MTLIEDHQVTIVDVYEDVLEESACLEPTLMDSLWKN